MPLKKSTSKQAFSKNVEAEMHAGKPQKQALAIAYAVKRRAQHKARGGIIESLDQDRQLEEESTNNKSVAPMTFEDEQLPHPSEPLEHEYADKEDMGRQYAEGGIVNDELHSQRMEGDTTQFLSPEEDLESPWQDPHQGRSDETELKEFYGSPYDKLSDLNNERGNEDQTSARKGVLEKIMQRTRMRNMGR